MFKAPGSSSSPPSTPEKNNFFAISNPSTTPADPPPTSYTAASTTPAGIPPSSVFGGAIPFNTHNSTYKSQHRASPSRLRHATFTQDDDENDAMDEDQDMGDSIISADAVIPSVEGLNVSALAKALALKPTTLQESDGLILNTEVIIENLTAFANGRPDSDALDLALDTAVESLMGLWAQDQDVKRQQHGIGPGDNASPLTKSLFLTSLVLALHHAPRKQRGSNSRRSSQGPSHPKPIPEVLLDWLREYHNQFPEEFSDTLQTKPDPCAHDRFWDVVLSQTLRGDIANASRLLKEADFRHAVSALEDGAEQPGYRGKLLGNVQRVVNRAIVVLDSCPAVSSSDWNVKGPEWSIFRKRVSQALSDLEAFAEGSSADRPLGDDDAFEAQNFGLSSVRSDNLAISSMSRRAESKVPWSIYQNLSYLYGQLLGTRREIVAAAADWVEATIALAVWWDGEQDDEAQSGFGSTRRSQRPSQGPRLVDTLPRTAYQQRLSISLQQVISENEDAELQINAASSIQVGLACVFDGDLQGLITILQGWSWPVTAAVVETAQLGSWLNSAPAPSRVLMEGFDQSDLMVLSFAAQPGNQVKRDDVLKSYAARLSGRPILSNPRTNTTKEGWELAVQVLGRLDNAQTSETKISDLLNQLDLTAADRIEKVLALCASLRLAALGKTMAEKYADELATNSENYGGALYYYSRAHNATRVKEVINVLVSCCLVQSMAYPPHSQLDRTLASIINAPKKTLARLAMLDREAADLLSGQLSGYATLRKFYELRDQDVGGGAGQLQAKLRPMARKKEAASALVAVVESAADAIHGGLFDKSVESVVQVDGLLVLLGEALVFLNQPKRILSSAHLFTLIQAAEDISTISASIRQQCEECLISALTSAHSGDAPPSPQGLLAKTMDMSGEMSEFELIGSRDLRSEKSGSENGGSRVLGGERGGGGSGERGGGGSVKREWDWRLGMRRDATGDDVLKILRLGLARELARVWTEGEI